ALLGTVYVAPYQITYDTTLFADGSSQNLYVYVYDWAGNLNASTTNPVVVSVDNTDPTSSIIQPLPGANVTGTVNVRVVASDVGSGVEHVEIWNSTSFLGNAPFSAGYYIFSWDTTSGTQGAQTLYSRVYDNAGNMYHNSTGISVFVDNAIPNQADITSPTTGDNVSGTITIQAAVSDTGTGVYSVEFWYGPPGPGTQLGIDYSAPYSYTWDTTSVSDGAYSLYIKVNDYVGLSNTSSLVNITIDNTPPILTISYPTNGTEVYGATIWINGTSYDTMTGLVSFTWNDTINWELYKDPRVGDTTFALRNKTVVLGYVALTLNATDSVGNSEIATVYFNIIGVPTPTVDIQVPQDSAILNTNTIWINGTVTAGGSETISQMLIDNPSFTIHDDPTGSSSGTFSYYNSSPLADGVYTINVTAVNSISQKSYDLVTFRLDTTPPDTATITSPTAGANLSGTITILATATDTGGSGIAYVEFWNGSIQTGVLIGNDTTRSPYSTTWDTTLAVDGAHTLYVRAVDLAGNIRDSTGISVTVDNTLPNQADITSPVNGTYLRGNVIITATVADAGTGINYTEFYIGHPDTGTLIGTNYSSPSCSINWNTIGFDGIGILIYIKTYDFAGHALISSPANVTVDNQAPTTCVITAPAENANISGQVTVTATTQDNVGGSGIAYVEFWNGTPGSGQLIGNDTTPPSPFSILWDTTSWTDGVYLLQAKAVDYTGNSLVSAVRTVTVDNTPPNLAITTPTNGTTIYLSTSSTVWINGTTSDATTIVVSVKCNDSAFLLVKSPTVTDPSFAFRNQTAVSGLIQVLINSTDIVGNTQNVTLYFTVTTAPVPTVTITYPASDGLYLSLATIWINGTVTSGGGGHTISQMLINNPSFTIWDDPTGQESGVFSYYNSSPLADGAYTINVTAVNTLGLSDYALRSFTLDTIPPDSAVITSPPAGENVTGTITVVATATDTGGSGIAYVEFWNGSIQTGVLIGNDTTGSPYSTTWDTTLAVDGAHTLYVRAVDLAGNIRDSAGVSIIVDNTLPNQADIISPVNGTYQRGTILIVTTVADAGTGINYTEFYIGHPDTGTLLGTNFSSPTCSWSWNTIGYDGIRLLYIKTVDFTGHALISSPVNITIDNQAPISVVITSPADGSNISGQ
ncbi:MAG: hypothetical protein DRH17_13695, partial [Deltaproteobacteria bacterium]